MLGAVLVVLELDGAVPAVGAPDTGDALGPLEDDGEADGALVFDGERLGEPEDADGGEGGVRDGQRLVCSDDEKGVGEQLR